MSNYEIFVYGWIAIGFLSFPFILRYDAPYGRHTSNNWGPLVDNKIGWIVMELPALIVCPLLVLSSGNPLSDITKFFIILWVIHYFNRRVTYQFKHGYQMPDTIHNDFKIPPVEHNPHYYNHLSEKDNKILADNLYNKFTDPLLFT